MDVFWDVWTRCLEGTYNAVARAEGQVRQAGVAQHGKPCFKRVDMCDTWKVARTDPCTNCEHSQVLRSMSWMVRQSARLKYIASMIKHAKSARIDSWDQPAQNAWARVLNVGSECPCVCQLRALIASGPSWVRAYTACVMAAKR
eukprot:8009941-Alexandrium_andersonii.AAC.1